MAAEVKIIAKANILSIDILNPPTPVIDQLSCTIVSPVQLFVAYPISVHVNKLSLSAQ